MSKDKKHIDDLIKEGFSEPTFDNDIQDWSGISDRLDEKSTIDNVVFKAFEEIQSELPIGAWSDMNDSLDIDTVWNRIASRRKRKPMIFWWKVAGVFVLLGILAGQLSNYSPQPINTTETINKIATPGHKQNSATPENKTSSSSNNATNSSGQDSDISTLANDKVTESKTENSINNTLSNSHVTSNTISTSNSVNNAASNSNTQIGKNNNDLKSGNNSGEAKQADQSENNTASQEITPTQDPIETLPIEPLSSLEGEESTTLAIIEDSREQPTIPFRKKRFTIGAIGTLDNTWILDATTREGFSETSLVSNETSFGSSYGLYLDYSLPRNFSLSADVYINSTLKTRNYFYQDGNYIKRETRLEYYKFALQANKNIPFGRRKINAFHSGFGGYYSILQNEYDQLGANVENKNYYLNADFGLKLELGHQININRFVVSYGVHLDYGMYNIFRGTEEINATLNKTNNLSSGGYLRLGFRF